MRVPLLIPCVALGVFGFALGKILPSLFPEAESAPTHAAKAAPSMRATETAAALSAGTEAGPSDPEPAPSLNTLWQTARKDSASPADFRFQIMNALNRLSADQLVNLLQTEFQKTSFLHGERFDMQYAARRLSEMAPEKAASLWASHDAARAGNLNALILPWASKDPAALTNWVLTQPPEKQQAARGALSLAASSDPERFCGFAHQLTGVPGAGDVAASAMAAFLSKNNPEKDSAKALDFAGKLPEGLLRTRALAELAKSPEIDPQAHPEISRALAALPETETYQVGATLAKKADTLPPGPVRESAQRVSFREKAFANPAEAAKKLEQLSAESPDYPAAARGFVEGVARKDPASAAAWAVSIPASAPGQRAGALERAAAEYFKSNPQEARAWVEKAPLSDEEYRRLTGRPRSR